jgi:hypothetical protein
VQTFREDFRLAAVSLFASRNGTPWDQNLFVKRKLRPLLEKLGISRAGLHAFRHFSASAMDRLNVPLKLRQQRLGHSDAEMTLGVYSHVAKEDDVRIAAQLGEILDLFSKRKGLLLVGKPLSSNSLNWLRGLDLNQRPSGYEPDELPGCSTPRLQILRDLRLLCNLVSPRLPFTCPLKLSTC